jgi:hypothetical protein
VPEPLSNLRDDLPPGLDEAIAVAFAKPPSQRYATAKEFANVLRKHLDQTNRDVAAETAAMIGADFTGELASVLGVKSLEELEAAWRKFSDRPGLVAQLSMPPTINLRLAARPKIDQTERTVSAPPPPMSTVPAASAQQANRRQVPTVVAAALVAAGVAVAVVFGLRGTTPPSEPHFLVVESKQDAVTATAAPASASAIASTPEAPSAVQDNKKKASLGTKPPRAEPDGRDTLNAVTRTFTRRQSAVQQCFQSHASSVTGSPEVSIRFSIDTQGQVTSAAVRPGTVAATALGACLEQVARATAFGAQEKPLTFSIPITAHAR